VYKFTVVIQHIAGLVGVDVNMIKPNSVAVVDGYADRTWLCDT
jgi:hypothetical protein